jgi:CHAT domain-containing protein
VRISIRDLVYCILFGLLCPLLSSVHSVAQPAAQPVKSPREQVAEAREKLRAAELAHPGNAVEVAEALDYLVGRLVDVEGPSPELLELVKREVVVAEAAAGPRSKLYANALATNSDVYVTLGRPAEGRPLAERAFEIALKEFPDAPELIEAADELMFACDRLGDFSCAQRAGKVAIAVERKIGAEHEQDLANTLSEVADIMDRMGDHTGASVDYEESLSIILHNFPNDPHLGIFEANVGLHYVRIQEFSKATLHLNRALELNLRNYGPGTDQVNFAILNLADLYSRTGEFPLAWKNFETAIGDKLASIDDHATAHSMYARSLASGGNLPHAIQEGLQSTQMARERFVLQARTLPERQALTYYNERPSGLDIALSVLSRHPEMPSTDIYQEVARSRALVADEMARRQKNLNASSDPEIARLLKEMDQSRADLLAIEQKEPTKQDNGDAVVQATSRMEKIERELAERSVDQRSDQRVSAVRLDDVRRGLPAQSALISYVAYQRYAVEKVDPARSKTPAYLAFVLKPGSESIHVFDLGDAKPIDDLVSRARASADAEAHAGGLGGIRNERAWREAGEALRKLVWDPLRAEVGDAKLALVVPDGILNLIPFSGLPEGKGYLVEHGPVIHVLSSERDLIPAESQHTKTGLVAFGNPSFGQTGDQQLVAGLRDAGVSCKNLETVESRPLPGTAAEVNDLQAAWQRWNGKEASTLETGVDATRARFLDEAPRSRVLHVATHAFLLDSSCGDGNPLLRSGLIFASDSQTRKSSILTAQQIASMDLNGVDWAVLSACNTGNGELRDGEGVLGLERAFRVAGARTVVMSLWSVDDDLTGQFMHELYVQRLGLHASTADAVWNAERKLLLARRAAGKSTHPWYWAGFVGAGGWE